jgi:hypothetical protein
VVIRVNVEDDENACYMTDDPYFWPRGITCRPWITKGAKKNSTGDQYDDYNDDGYDRPINKDNDYDHTYSCREWIGKGYSGENRYHVLSSEIDN